MNLPRRPRGKGVRRKVSGYTKLPDNWMDFLRDSKEGSLLFPRLDSSAGYQPTLCMSHHGKLWFPLVKESPYCDHEKADTRIVVHVLHVLKQGQQTIYVHTVDRDVVVIIAGMIWLRLNNWATSEWP